MKYLVLCLLLLLSMALCAENLQNTIVKADSLSKISMNFEAGNLMADYLTGNPDSPYQLELSYQIACYYSLAKKTELAFNYLNKAYELGFTDRKWMEKDTDLNNLHKDKHWKQFIAMMEEKEESLLATLPLERNFLLEIPLPEPRKTSNVSVEQALNQRRSVREYSDSTLTLADVSQILWSAYGITQVVAPEQLRGGLRTAPSAGGLYPLEIYLGAWNVEGLDPGFYYYQPEGHKLQLVKKGDLRSELTAAALGQDYINYAPAALVYSAIFERTTKKYGDRGRERYVLMDLGHSAENVYLQAETLNIGTVAIGAFDDLKLRLLIPLTKAEEPLYIMPFGKKQ
jgi:SagB-type dehydrogenase family enzyme